MNRQFPQPSIASTHIVKHLATFNIGKYLSAEDGMKKFKVLENASGINSMDCEIVVDKKHLTIFDMNTRQEIEVIPLKLIDEPTSVINEDKSDPFNNILLFTANYNLKNSEMHFFQCVNRDFKFKGKKIFPFTPIAKTNSFNLKSIDIVDEILAIKEGRCAITTGGKRDSYSVSSLSSNTSTLVQPKEQQYIQQERIINKDDINNNLNLKQSYLPLSESIDEDVKVLNHCFDDIEQFISKLQTKSKTDDEIDSKGKNKVKKNKKDKKANTNASKLEQSFISVASQALLPEVLEDRHFIDILQKFKLAFNLLAKLKQHIHDPNAPELIHFLFTPLNIIVQSLYMNSTQLCNATWSPLITKDAKDLLLNCLTSKEYDLWQSLGDAWITTDDEITTQIHAEAYHPVFYDGWSPSLNQNHQARHGKKQLVNNYYDPMSHQQQIQYRQKNLTKEEVQEVSQVNENDAHFYEMEKWALNLQQNGVKVYEVINDREGNNNKELTVKSGELVEILDDRRNWWRIRNVYGLTGHAPHTILQPFDFNNKRVGYF